MSSGRFRPSGGVRWESRGSRGAARRPSLRRKTPFAPVPCGFAAEVKRKRKQGSEHAEAAAIADTMTLLRDALGNDRLERLLEHGARLDVADALAIALAPDSTRG